MQYLININNKSPLHKLWRSRNIHHVEFLGTTFIFNKQTQQYEADGHIPNLGSLMRHPHITVNILTNPAGEVKTITSKFMEEDPITEDFDPPELRNLH